MGSASLLLQWNPLRVSRHLSPPRPSASGQINLQEESVCEVPSDPMPKGGITGTQEILGSGGISSEALPAALGLPPPQALLEGQPLKLGGTWRVEGPLSSQPPPPPLLTVTASPFSSSPTPASWSTPMPSRTPEMGQVPVRQADITDGHSQTQKKPGTVGTAEPPAPLGCMEVGLIPAGSRQPADIKIPRNLMKACSLFCPVLSSSKRH